MVKTALVMLLLAASVCCRADVGATAERGWMTRPGEVSAIACPEGFNPIFGHWAVQYGAPLESEFRARPNTEYQVLVALREVYWPQPGKRILDVEISGEKRATVDSYGGPGGAPHAIVCRGTTGTTGVLRVAIKPNPGSSDQNAVVCGLMLFPGGIHVDTDAVIHDKGPKPLVSIDPATPQKRIPTVGDGRLCFGNGYVFGTFVGPLEYAEEPITRVHDKISRLYLGYSSAEIAQVGMAPRITDLSTGRSWTVGACDSYRVENGAVIMETKLPVGSVRTETYGAWDKPILVRRIIFTPSKGAKGDFVVSTDASIYRDFSMPTDPDAARNYQLCTSTPDWPTSLRFPSEESLSLSNDGRVAEWSYNSPLYRKVALTSTETQTTLDIRDGSGRSVGKHASFAGESAGTLHFERRCGKGRGSLTVVLAFDRELPTAAKLLTETPARSLRLSTVQKRWDGWYHSGAVVTTANRKMDEAYRSQMLSWKMALDAELGGVFVGGRYQNQTVWTRDTGVGVAVMLDAGHYEDVKKTFRFFAEHAYWNEANNCLHANYHASGRVMKFMCAPGQAPVEEIVQPGEWNIQMAGPQLDGMAYYLYNIGKYYRCTGDKAFIKELWPFISKVADALAKDEELTCEIGIPSGYIKADGKYDKYNPETGLIVENCTESGVIREHLLMNALAVLGFREAYRLSQVVGDEKPLWNRRAASIDAAIHRYLIVDGGKTFLAYMPRPWLDDGKPVEMGAGGYFWSCAATVPYLNYRDPRFRDYIKRHVDPEGNTPGWGMWYATLAQAAYEADLPDTGWNYLSKLADRLPESHQIYEHVQDVVDSEGTARTVTLNLFGFNYLVHAVIRGLSGLGYDTGTGQWFLRPQISGGIGTVRSSVRVGKTWFHVTSSGSGDRVAEFAIDGDPQPLDGILRDRYLDGKTHTVRIRMATL